MALVALASEEVVQLGQAGYLVDAKAAAKEVGAMEVVVWEAPWEATWVERMAVRSVAMREGWGAVCQEVASWAMAVLAAVVEAKASPARSGLRIACAPTP